MIQEYTLISTRIHDVPYYTKDRRVPVSQKN